MNLKAFGASFLYWSVFNRQHALLKSATILINFNINHQQIYRSLLKMPQVYSAIFYRLMMSFNVISYVSNNASHICCYRAKRSCFQDCPTQFSHKLSEEKERRKKNLSIRWVAAVSSYYVKLLCIYECTRCLRHWAQVLCYISKVKQSPISV